MIRATLIAFVIAIAAPSYAAAADVSGEIGIVSSYRDRGLDLARSKPAVQADLLVEHKSGFYVDLWGSTLGRWPEIEVDLSAGYQTQLSDAVGVDLYATYVAYPSDWRASYAEATAVLNYKRGPATLRGGLSAAPPQGGTRDGLGRKRANGYVFVQAEYALASMPLTLSASTGHERGPFDLVADGGKWDWSLGANVALDPVALGLRYTGSNADEGGEHALTASLFLGW